MSISDFLQGNLVTLIMLLTVFIKPKVCMMQSFVNCLTANGKDQHSVNILKSFLTKIYFGAVYLKLSNLSSLTHGLINL